VKKCSISLVISKFPSPSNLSAVTESGANLAGEPPGKSHGCEFEGRPNSPHTNPEYQRLAVHSIFGGNGCSWGWEYLRDI